MPVTPFQAAQPLAFAPSEVVAITASALMVDAATQHWDGCIVLQGGKVLAAGERATTLPRFPRARVLDASGYMLIPGLINAHTHCALSFFRGLGYQPMPAGSEQSIIETVMFPAERSLTPDMTEPLSYSYIFDGLRSGVTCFVDHYYYIAGVGQALERFGVRGVIGETVADLGGAKPGREAWDRARHLIDAWPFSNRVTPAVAPHAADTVSRGWLKEMAEFARQRHLPLHMHLSQTTGERQRVLSREGITPVRMAAECGALSERSLIVHLVTADADDLGLIADSGSTIGFCPASQILYERLAPIHAFLQHGIPVVVGTDCAASNDTADMLQEVRFASLMANSHLPHDQPLATKTALSWYGEQAATSLGLGGRIGSLTPGSCADLVLLRLDASTQPMPSIANGLLYTLGSRHVQHVMVDGRWVLWNQASTLVPEDDQLDAIKTSVNGILQANSDKR